MRHRKHDCPEPLGVIDDDSGMTVLELMIVLVILSLIAAVGTVQVVNQLDRAKTDVAALQLRQIENAIEMFYLDVRRYPSVDEGLAALRSPPPEAGGWRGPYLKTDERLVDPWGHSVVYQVLDAGYVLISYGSDGKERGEGMASDILVKGGA